MYTFGKRSQAQLDTCHKDLQWIANEALKASRVDFSIIEGARPLALQQKYFKEGKSKIDGIKVKGNHNYQPSRAFDIAVYVSGKPKLTYDTNHLCYIAGIIIGVSERLYALGQTNHKIRWGGNWDRDGEILTDQNFDDMPHFELKKT